jgi:hypothetical protein
LLQLRYDYRRPERTHYLQYGGRALVGSGRLNAFAEVTGTHRWNAPAGIDAGTGSWTAGVEVRLVEQLWIATGFGSGFSTEGAEQVTVIAHLRTMPRSQRPRARSSRTRPRSAHRAAGRRADGTAWTTSEGAVAGGPAVGHPSRQPSSRRP